MDHDRFQVRIRTVTAAIAWAAIWLSLARYGVLPGLIAAVAGLGLFLSVRVARLVVDDARPYGRLAMGVVGVLAFTGAAMVILPLLACVLVIAYIVVWALLDVFL